MAAFWFWEVCCACAFDSPFDLKKLKNPEKGKSLLVDELFCD